MSSRQELRSRKSTCCKSWSSWPSGNKALLRGQFLRQQRHLRQRGRVRESGELRKLQLATGAERPV